MERKTLNMKKKLLGKLLDGKGEGATITSWDQHVIMYNIGD